MKVPQPRIRLAAIDQPRDSSHVPKRSQGICIWSKLFRPKPGSLKRSELFEFEAVVFIDGHYMLKLYAVDGIYLRRDDGICLDYASDTRPGLLALMPGSTHAATAIQGSWYVPLPGDFKHHLVGQSKMTSFGRGFQGKACFFAWLLHPCAGCVCRGQVVFLVAVVSSYSSRIRQGFHFNKKNVFG